MPRPMIFSDSPSGMTATTSTGSGSVGPRTMQPGRIDARTDMLLVHGLSCREPQFSAIRVALAPEGARVPERGGSGKHRWKNSVIDRGQRLIQLNVSINARRNNLPGRDVGKT